MSLVDMTSAAFKSSSREPLWLRPSSPLVVFVRVINAIILREVLTRFGRDQIGYLRAVVEPVALMLAFGMVFLLLDRAPPIAVPLSLFLLTGVCAWVAFTRAWGYLQTAIEGNKQLLAFPIVRPLDFFIGRAILEVATQTLVFGLLALILHGILNDTQYLPEDPFGVLLAFWSVLALAIGLAW